MREFKFRAWALDKKCWIHKKMVNTSLMFYAQDRDSIVQQFIGRMDVNEKEIYEGDIVYDKNYANIPLIVRWSNPLSKFIIENRGYCLNFVGLGKYEVIGNIYENPELLNV